jgi:hypothetical protein
MYIEFDIITSMDSFDNLRDSVSTWARRYKIPFTTKVAKDLKYRLGLNHPEHFTLFTMTWTACDYKIKNIDRS